MKWENHNEVPGLTHQRWWRMNRYLIWYKRRETWPSLTSVSTFQSLGRAQVVPGNANQTRQLQCRHGWTKRLAPENVLMSDTLMCIGNVPLFMDYVTNELLTVECGQVFASWFPVVMGVNAYNARDGWSKCDNLFEWVTKSTLWWGKLWQSLFDGVWRRTREMIHNDHGHRRL